MSLFFLFFFFFFGQSGEAIRWRVCYQRGRPCLVFVLLLFFLADLFPPLQHLLEEGVQARVSCCIKIVYCSTARTRHLYIRLYNDLASCCNKQIAMSPLHLSFTPCTTSVPVNRLFVTPNVSTCNQPIEEVVITTTLVCRTVTRCGSDTVLFGLSKSLNLHRKQGY